MTPHKVHAPTSPITYDSAERDLGVVVGFDGSEGARLALHYAARAAQRRSVALTVVYCFTIPPYISGYMDQIPQTSQDELIRQGGNEVLDDARTYLEGYPGEVTYRLEEGDAAGVLVSLSRFAQALVVGGRGRGGFWGRILGSVSSALPAHAHCPTVVVPRDYDPSKSDKGRFEPVEDPRPVVVGVDGSTHSRVAVLQAAEAARVRGVQLRILMALPPMDGVLPWYPELDTWEDANARTESRRRELEKKLDHEADWVSQHYPTLEVATEVETGTPADVVAEATKKAQLTVVGTRGRSGIASAFMGSTSRGVLLKAGGTVMVVPRLKDERLENQPHFGI